MKPNVIYIGHGQCGVLGLKEIQEKYLDKINLVYVVNHRETSDDPNAVPEIAKLLGTDTFNRLD